MTIWDSPNAPALILPAALLGYWIAFRTKHAHGYGDEDDGGPDGGGTPLRPEAIERTSWWVPGGQRGVARHFPDQLTAVLAHKDFDALHPVDHANEKTWGLWRAPRAAASRPGVLPIRRTGNSHA